MTHARTQIRERAVVLATGLTTTGTRVHDARLFELEDPDLPLWDVSTSVDEEESENVSMGGEQQRIATLTFTGVARQTTGISLQQLLDVMAEELETVIVKAAFKTPTKLLSGFAYVGTEFEFDVEETDQAIGAIIVTYGITYHVAEGSPGTIL